jgi:type IV pilus assembly protein PilA
MIVVAIVGVLAALAIYGVRRYLFSAKTAEVRNAVGQMAKDSSTAYSRENTDPGLIPTGESSATVSHRLCGSAAAAVPDDIGKVKGRKYQSSPADWNTGDQVNGWRCLKFSVADPQYYQYNYTSTGTPGAADNKFQAIGMGDLNGDGTAFSTFRMEGEVREESGVLELFVSPNMFEENPEE